MKKNRVKQAKEIFTILHKQNLKPTTELNYSTNFELLVAVVLSAQATDISVNKAMLNLFPVANTPQAILQLGVEGLEPYIQKIGLYRAKAKNIIGLCKVLIEEYNSRVPDTFEDLIKLPGVGRKTANVILNTAFGKPTIAVDTHVYRVANRLGLSNGKTPIKVEEDLLQIIPKEFKTDAHHWLILHGRYICKARKPECEVCSISGHCDYYTKMTN